MTKEHLAQLKKWYEEDGTLPGISIKTLLEAVEDLMRTNQMLRDIARDAAWNGMNTIRKQGEA